MSDDRARIDAALDKIAAAMGDLTEAVRTAENHDWANDYLSSMFDVAGFTQSTEETEHALMLTEQDRRETWSNCRPPIDLNAVAADVQRITGYTCHLEQTGGGTATLYVWADETLPGDHALAVAGPGWFTTPSWTTARADWEGFCIGLDDDTQDIHWYPQREYPCPTDREIAEIIADYAGATHQNINTEWRNVDPEAKPSWAYSETPERASRGVPTRA